VSDADLARLWHEVNEQPAVIEGLLASQRAAVTELASLVRQREPSTFVLVARGSSDHAAIYGRYLFEICNQRLTSLAAPSALTLYGSGPRLDQALVIGVSQSGQGEDVVAYVARARDQGATTVAITNDEASPLAQTADWRLACRAGPERSIPATKTVTAEMCLLAMLSAALGSSASSDITALRGAPSTDVPALGDTLPSDVAAPGGTLSSDLAARGSAPSTDVAALGDTLPSDVAAPGSTLSSDVTALGGTLSSEVVARGNAVSGDLAARRDAVSSAFAALAPLPAAIACALEQRPVAAALAQRLVGRTIDSVIGRGFAFPPALEIALKLKETSYTPAEPFSAADFLHGPVALVEADYTAVVVDVGGRSSVAAQQIAQGVRARGGQPVLVRAADAAAPSVEATVGGPHLVLQVPVAEPYAPIVALVLGQLLAIEVALARGLDPAQPRGLRKVTSTR